VPPASASPFALMALLVLSVVVAVSSLTIIVRRRR
jgi:hypothetical protein